MCWSQEYEAKSVGGWEPRGGPQPEGAKQGARMSKKPITLWKKCPGWTCYVADVNWYIDVNDFIWNVLIVPKYLKFCYLGAFITIFSTVWHSSFSW